MALPRTSWRRRPLLVLILLIVLLVIGYAARALDGGSRTGSQPVSVHVTSSLPAGAHLTNSLPAGAHVTSSLPTGAHLTGSLLPQTAQDGGRLAAKAAMPSCACGPAK